MATTGNDYAEQDIRDTLCLLNNSPICPPSRVITCQEALQIILDKFVRGGVDLTTMTSADVEQITENVGCAYEGMAYPEVNYDKLIVATLWAVNQA